MRIVEVWELCSNILYIHMLKNVLTWSCLDIFLGYGHTVPKTDRGKIFCMIYAAVGIPLALTMFQAIGERLNTFLAHMFRRVKKKFGMKNTEVSNTANMVVLFGLFCMVVTVCSGAFIFSHYEKWTYFQSLYYCFITVTTIGFGDYVALQDSQRFNDTYVGISLLFIFFGLTIVGSVMNQLALRLLTASQTKEPTEQLIHEGPRCDKCASFRSIHDFEQFEPYLDNSSTLLKNFEEEISFTTYKGLHRKRASIWCRLHIQKTWCNSIIRIALIKTVREFFKI